MMTRDLILQANNLSKSYASKGRNMPKAHLQSTRKIGRPISVLDNITLSVYAGESVGIIGGNGSGKTTLAKILANIIPCDQGEVITQANIGGIIGGNLPIYHQLTGKQNIFILSVLLGMSKQEINHAWQKIAEFADITDYLDVQTKHYSTGMLKRLGVSIALHADKDIYIMDEALSNLDAEFTRKSISLLKQKCAEQTKACIIISHQINVIHALCQRVIIMEKGHIIKQSSDILATTEQHLT